MTSTDESTALINHIEIEAEHGLHNCENGQFYGPISLAFDGSWPTEETLIAKIRNLLRHFTKEDGALRYFGRLCIPRKSVGRILELAHDSKLPGHFGYSKTMSRLGNFNWKHMSRDVGDYKRGCSPYQQFEDSRSKV